MNREAMIPWVHATCQVTAGCQRVSPGCANCHAVQRSWLIAHNKQVAAHKREAYRRAVTRREGRLEWSGQIKAIPGWLGDLASICRGRGRKRIFMESMGDLFHPGVPPAELIKLFAFAARTPGHDFLLLTKRPDAMRDTTARLGLEWPANIWAGTTLESQEQYWRVEALLKIPARVRFLSCDPLLGPLDLSRALHMAGQPSSWVRCANCGKELGRGQGIAGGSLADGELACSSACYEQLEEMGCPLESRRIDWVVCGTESIGGRPGRDPGLAPIRSLRHNCCKAGVPFFLKQAAIDGRTVKMPWLDGRVWDQVPEAGR